MSAPTIALSVWWARRSACSVPTRSVTATNGVDRGTSNTGIEARRAAASSASGTASLQGPVPNPMAAAPVLDAPRTKAAASSVRRQAVPVVNSSSPPRRNGVLSTSSVVIATRTGRSRRPSPTRNLSFSSPQEST